MENKSWLSAIIAVAVIILFIGTVMFYTGKDPVEPEEDKFPITTAAAALELVNEKFGIECVGEDFEYLSTIELQTEPDEFGYVGNQVTNNDEEGNKHVVGYNSMIECKSIEERFPDGRPKSGAVIFSVRYDPNNGYLIHQFCNGAEFPTECKDVPFKYSNYVDNPDYEIYYNLNVEQ